MTMRRHPTTWLQSKGKDKPETNPSVPQQEEQPDATEDKDIVVDYDPGSEPKSALVTQEQKEEDPNAEYGKMELLQQETFYQIMIPWEMMKGIQWVHREQGPEIMASWLTNTYIQLGFSPKAVKLLFRVQGLDSLERLRALTDKNINDICNFTRKPGDKNSREMPNRGQQVSVIAKENLKLAAFLFHHR